MVDDALSYSLQEHSFYIMLPKSCKSVKMSDNPLLISLAAGKQQYICRALRAVQQQYCTIGTCIQLLSHDIELQCKVVYEDPGLSIKEIVGDQLVPDELLLISQQRTKPATPTYLRPLLVNMPLVNACRVTLKFLTFEVEGLPSGIFRASSDTKICIETRRFKHEQKQEVDLLAQFVEKPEKCYLSHLGPLQQLVEYFAQPSGGVVIHGSDCNEQLFHFVNQGDSWEEYMLDYEEVEQGLDDYSKILYHADTATQGQFARLYRSEIRTLVFKMCFPQRSPEPTERDAITTRVIQQLDSEHNKFYQPRLHFRLVQLVDDPEGQDRAIRRCGRFGTEICCDRPDQPIRRRITNAFVASTLIRRHRRVSFCMGSFQDYVYMLEHGVDLAKPTSAATQALLDYIVNITNGLEYSEIISVFRNINPAVQGAGPESVQLEDMQQLVGFMQCMYESYTQEATAFLQSLADALKNYTPQLRALSLNTIELNETMQLFEDIETERLEKGKVLNMLSKNSVLFNCKEQVAVLKENFQPEGDKALLAELDITPQHVLLYGEEPGCGKSMVCRYIVRYLQEYRVLEVSCTDIFSQYLGESEQNVIQIFRRARRLRPCVLVFEGLDYILGLRRGADEDETGVSARVLTQFLTELDGVSRDNRSLVCIGVCGCDVSELDSAIVRYKRFGLHIHFGPLSCDYVQRVTHWAGVASSLDATSPGELSHRIVQLLEDELGADPAVE